MDTPVDLEPLREVVGDAFVVGIARGAHGAAELTRQSDRLARWLVTELGFRTLAIEADVAVAAEVDTRLRAGQSDLGAPLAATHPWWRTPEFRDVLDWMGEHDRRRPDDPVELIGVDHPAPDMDAMERLMAETIVSHVERTGQRVVYWSGSHSSVGRRRAIRWRPGDVATQGANAGSLLRERFGDGYRSVGLSFHHGSVRWDDDVVAVPPPPEAFLGSLLDDRDLTARVVDLRRGAPRRAPARIADAPLLLRSVGPSFDPAWPAALSGGTVAEFFDAVIHLHEVTPAAMPGM